MHFRVGDGMYEYAYMRTYLSMNVYKFTCLHTCTWIIYIYIYIYIYISIICVYVHIYIERQRIEYLYQRKAGRRTFDVFVCVYIYIHIHTHTQLLAESLVASKLQVCLRIGWKQGVELACVLLVAGVDSSTDGVTSPAHACADTCMEIVVFEKFAP